MRYFPDYRAAYPRALWPSFELPSLPIFCLIPEEGVYEIHVPSHLLTALLTQPYKTLFLDRREQL